MICTKNGGKYVMVVECQGVNYDLMSEVEKNAVEEGFIQFLIALKAFIINYPSIKRQKNYYVDSIIKR